MQTSINYLVLRLVLVFHMKISNINVCLVGPTAQTICYKFTESLLSNIINVCLVGTTEQTICYKFADFLYLD